MSTGGGASTRKFYSNTEEEAFSAMRPVMINGISELATRPDLADRTVFVELKKIECYIPEAELERDWEQDCSQLTGSLYDLLSNTLAELPNVHINKPPRMADFAQLGQAMFNVLEVDESFSEIFSRNRDHVVMRAIESSPVALAIIDLLDSQYSTGKFRGTMKQLLSELSNNKPKFFDPSAWPKSPRGLGDIVKRVTPALLVRGIEVQKDDKPKKDGYHVTISKVKPVEHNRVDVVL